MIVTRPKVKEQFANIPELKSLIETCEEHLTEIENHEEEDSDTPHYIYEEVMQVLYGKDIFKWMNSKE